MTGRVDDGTHGAVGDRTDGTVGDRTYGTVGDRTYGTADDAVEVTVAVASYRRPEGLATLLGLLGDQRTADGGRPAVVVVDNDPDGSAGPVTAAAATTASGVRYVHEPRPGISAARNAALEAVPAGLVVFVDDDEEPGPAWLHDLTACWAVHRAGTTPLAGVVGPVVSRYEVEPDAWVRAGRFFDRRRLPTGTAVTVAATNNLLLDRAVVGDLRFDEAFGLSGGSDTLFTRRLTGSGARLVWCDEAVVTDVVPADRVTRGWVLRRARRMGNSWSRCDLVLARGPAVPVRARLLVAGGARWAGGSALRLAGLATGSLVRQARGARLAARGAGMASGALGHVVAEYRRSAAVDALP